MQSNSPANVTHGGKTAASLFGATRYSLGRSGSPLFIEPAEIQAKDLSVFFGWLTEQRSALDALLLQHGGIVFRGSPVSSSAEFSQFAQLLGPYSGTYSGGASAREKIVGNVMEATRLAKEIKIPLHQEMSYLRNYPGRIVFYCVTPAAKGGETITADMRRFTRDLPEAIRSKLESTGISVVRNFAAPAEDGSEQIDDHPDQRSWKSAFYADTREAVEATCEDKGMQAIWNDDGSLTVRNTFAAFTRHPVTGELIYRNVAHVDPGAGFSANLPEARRQRVEAMLAHQALRTGYYFGDGSPISVSESAQLRALFDRLELSWAWRPGDIMLLDNLLMAHGRNSFEGEFRDVQVALLA
jgi:alpha-ketoglutarate-dependent taurine dioxygenase